MNSSQPVHTDETHALIGSDKVEGTAVYGADRSKIGTVERVMLNKRDGKAQYAVLSFGGFLGMGEKHHPIPWEQLTYDTQLDGYVVSMTRDQLENAPSYGSGDEMDWTDRSFQDRVTDYYGPTRGNPPMI
jgi:hypothetical protein